MTLCTRRQTGQLTDKYIINFETNDCDNSFILLQRRFDASRIERSNTPLKLKQSTNYSYCQLENDARSIETSL